MVVREWLRMQEPELHRVRFLHLCQEEEAPMSSRTVLKIVILQ